MTTSVSPRRTAAVDPSRARHSGPAAPNAPRIGAVGTAVTENSYTQRELIDTFRITDPKIRSVFLSGSIERRHLTLPPVGPDGTLVPEIQGELLAKHTRVGVEMGSRALLACLEELGADLADVDYLCCVTTTGFLTPGLSARIIRHLGIDPGCHRADIVGMGCNAGLNALNGTAAWSAANPGRLAVMVCAEVCSAAYVFDNTMRTAVVNSLFGDGAAAIALIAPGQDAPDPFTSGPAAAAATPRILDFSSHIITDALDAMRYDWDDDQNRFSFYLDPEIPYVVGANAEQVVDRLLARSGLRRSDIAHWLVHSGGKKVIDAVRVNLGLTRHEVRHTTGVLRDYGNLSSGSFLFSYDRLMREGSVRPGDYGVMMTMGPGSTIETALIRW
ncbi:3,5-dihydroxyphenylacetyl-CoA synthase DpgA [Kitasatospora sp. NPDC051170]|uniref:3,5-dihydroxyphenylacetyl-CoA synthase DpgA n=1 Tax=Kitasatospora sp. NPDC051170 TaxID=3364056 RepID=UPI0037AFA453